MDIRVLRYFIQVARDESITRAARTLHISQPSLSRAMKELEEELGTKLFVRSNYSVRLTNDGIRLRLRAEDIVSMADQTLDEFRRNEETVDGDIRIGAAEGEPVRVLGQTMNELKETYPGIRYHMYTGDTEMLKEKLDSGFLDFLVIAEDPDHSKYQSHALPLEDRWGVWMRKDDPLAKKDSITKKDLLNLPLSVSRQAMQRDLGRFFGDDAHRMHIVSTYDLAHNSILLAEEGFGYCLCFEHLADTDEGRGAVFREIVPPLTTQMHLIYRRYQIFSRQAQLFLDTLENLIAEKE